MSNRVLYVIVKLMHNAFIESWNVVKESYLSIKMHKITNNVQFARLIRCVFWHWDSDWWFCLFFRNSATEQVLKQFEKQKKY